MTAEPIPTREALEAEWFQWLCRKYVQRADDRQRSMGLQYTEAETHNLAAEIAKHESAALDRYRAAGVEAERWRPIDWNAPPKEAVLLFYPETDRGGRNHLLNYWRVGYAGDTPRRPTHYKPLGLPPPATTSEGE